MKTCMEPTAEDLLRAEQYWEEQKQRVKLLAKQLGHEDFEPSMNYLFDLFTVFDLTGNGEVSVTDEQILEELAEDFAEE